MLHVMAEQLTGAGVRLAQVRDPQALAQGLVDVAIELEVATAAAFIGRGDLRHVRAGAEDADLPDAASPLTLRDPTGSFLAHGRWVGVRIGQLADTGRDWSGTLWVADLAGDSHDTLQALALQAGVALLLVRERRDLEESRRRQAALVEAGKALTQQHDLDALLRNIVELATGLVGATYGALGIVGADGETLERFITTGIDEATRAQIGELPTGRGILGVLIRDPRPLRLARLQDDPRSSGFPPGHPPMQSFLGLPIVTRGEVKGRLYLTEKRGADRFSEDDEAVATSLASQAAIAIDNAELYAALVTANTKLDQASQHKSTFLASMSHELRSPLNTILGYTQLLLEQPGALDEEQREDLAIIQSSGQHLLGLIADLLDLGRIETDRIVLYRERVDLRALVTEVVASLLPQLAEGVDCAVPQFRGDVEIDADPSRVRQMLLNVLGNAAKFTTSGEIRVTVERTGSAVRVVVEDDGPGIPPEDVDRLFESFYQSQSALRRTPRAREGAGLGLAITQRLARLHGGDVTIESTLGRGTMVTMTLPVQEPRETGGERDV